jgi:type I site-specific restriction-modification system R (restriction) subunit
MTTIPQPCLADYADIYDIRQAIEDNATVPIYYEMPWEAAARRGGIARRCE